MRIETPTAPPDTTPNGEETGGGYAPGPVTFVVVLALLIALVVWLAGGQESAERLSRPTIEQVRSERVASNPTMAQFMQVQPGMTVVQVENIIEKAGTLHASTGAMDIYTWTNGAGGTVSVTFNDRFVIAKAQVGLQ